jgi:basic amino acid/polyamine antiporter, APA family
VSPRTAGGDGDGGERLVRRLGTTDAVVIGMGSMIGAGIFAALQPAALAAGSGLLVGLAIAGVVAYCNATSSAQLAAAIPRAGGTYTYGRERLGPLWGSLAGWGFVVGKIASLAAMGLTFGAYVSESHARALGVGAVIAMTAVNYLGVTKTAFAVRVILAVVLGALAAVVVATFGGGAADAGHLSGLTGRGWLGILRSAGLLFFAFAGYARIATLGEEVRDPAHTIPRAIPLALGLTLIVYALVGLGALLAAGPDVLAAAPAPLVAAVTSGSLAWLAPVVRVGAAVASVGVVLSLLAGVSRTVFAMARDRELPGALDSVHPRYRTPHRAELTVGLIVVLVILIADLRGAIGFSSFTILTYYAIANVAAWTQGPDERRFPKAIQVLGLIGCATLALTLPLSSVVVGSCVLAAGAIAREVVRRQGRSR